LKGPLNRELKPSLASALCSAPVMALRGDFVAPNGDNSPTTNEILVTERLPQRGPFYRATVPEKF